MARACRAVGSVQFGPVLALLEAAGKYWQGLTQKMKS